MGFRFRRTIKILPGIRLNVSKSGVSTSIGSRGATVNIGAKGARATVGLPGTGISYSEKLSGVAQQKKPHLVKPENKNDWAGVLFVLALLAISWVISKL